MRERFYALSAGGIAVSLALAMVWPAAIALLVVVLAFTALGIHDMRQVRHAVLRNFPVAGRGRYIMEWLRPMMYQYFIESDTDGAPISRMYRSLVYQRAKGDLDSNPLGTKLNVEAVGYEWMDHSMRALEASTLVTDPRVTIGGAECLQPYDASILNISAMSFGALSKPAILALNTGAARGGFAHNTGEGGLSEYHLKPGGDIIWQIGTGYFGCRDGDGNFDAESFVAKASGSTVKMIEIKLSQGAKPGHGGILPAAKNTPEIAAVRGVTPFTQVDSPPSHSTFGTPLELLNFVAHLRGLSGGKPVGFKFCLGHRGEFVAICKAMVESGIRPDFITVDGGEGGTGAAPLEFSNRVGAPLKDALTFVVDCLVGFGLRGDIKVIASARLFSAFHLMRMLALGADACNSARGMMLALGCIQSLACHTNTCPTGVATQNPALYRGLDIEDKANRVMRYHHTTVHAAVELAAAAGLRHPSEMTRAAIHRRISQNAVMRYDQVFPDMAPGCLLGNDPPEAFRLLLAEARADTFAPVRA